MIKVLLVEPEKVFGERLKQGLINVGFDVDLTPDVLDAFDKLQIEPCEASFPDMVIVDISNGTGSVIGLVASLLDPSTNRLECPVILLGEDDIDCRDIERWTDSRFRKEGDPINDLIKRMKKIFNLKDCLKDGCKLNGAC